MKIPAFSKLRALDYKNWFAHETALLEHTYVSLEIQKMSVFKDTCQ